MSPEQTKIILSLIFRLFIGMVHFKNRCQDMEHNISKPEMVYHDKQLVPIRLKTTYNVKPTLLPPVAIKDF